MVLLFYMCRMNLQFYMKHVDDYRVTNGSQNEQDNFMTCVLWKFYNACYLDEHGGEPWGGRKCY